MISRRLSNPSAPRRAFTLLELLLAVTVLASVTGLVAATWSQMNSWVADNGREQRQLHLHRVLKLMTDQWEDRRSTTPMGENSRQVITGDSGVGFVTATPILFPEWPLVRAAYRIVPTPDRRPGEPETWDLLYVEVRVTELGAPPEDEEEKKEGGPAPRRTPVNGEETWAAIDNVPQTDAWGGELRRTLVLLEGCAELRLERFGLAADIFEEAGLSAPATENAAPRTGEPGATRPEAGERGEGPTRLDPMDSGAMDAARAAGVSDDIIRQATEMRWRPHGLYGGFVPAVRLVGIHEERDFTCVFAIRALH